MIINIYCFPFLSIETVFTPSFNTFLVNPFQVNASDVIILEGILVFHDQRVRNLMNMKIFVDTGSNSFYQLIYHSICIATLLPMVFTFFNFIIVVNTLV